MLLRSQVPAQNQLQHQMPIDVASDVMPRTTIDLDAAVLRELKRLGRLQHKSIGRVASELLSGALSQAQRKSQAAAPLKWVSMPMRARVDLEDKEALAKLLEES